MGLRNLQRFMGVSVYLTSDQTIAQSVTVMAAWDAEHYDTTDMHDTVTNNSRLTVPRSGYWRVSGVVDLYGASATAAARIAHIYVNNASAREVSRELIDPSAETYRAFSLTIPLIAGDYVELALFNFASVDQSLSSGSNGAMLQMEFVGC